MKKHKKNDKDNWQERALKETKKFSFDDGLFRRGRIERTQRIYFFYRCKNLSRNF